MSSLSTELIHYRYDALDRLISHAQPNVQLHQCFYCRNRLTTKIHGAITHTIVQSQYQLLAQQQRQDDELETTLLAVDQQRSVIHLLKAQNQTQPIAYSPYGHRDTEIGLMSLLGFNGERPSLGTGHYLLGNGYRGFNPTLMRFNSPDSLSPFGKGGLNPYIYCLGDPINNSDSTGHVTFRGAVRAIMASRRFEASLVAKTKTIKIPDWGTVTLNQGRAPIQAVNARAQMERLQGKLSEDPYKRAQFLEDFRNLKNHSQMVENMTGVPASQNDQLKLFKYLATPNAQQPTGYNVGKLAEAASGRFDHATPLNLRPSTESAINYRDRLKTTIKPDLSTIANEYHRIVRLNFNVERQASKIRNS